MEFPFISKNKKSQWLIKIISLLLLFLVIIIGNLINASIAQYGFALCTFLFFIYIIYQIIKKPVFDGKVIFEDTGILILGKKEERKNYSSIYKIQLTSYDGQFTLLRRSFDKGDDNYIQESAGSEKIYFYIEDDLKYKVLSRFLQKQADLYRFNLKVNRIL